MAHVPTLARADDLFQTFRTICVETTDIGTARRLAAALPGSALQQAPNRPAWYKLYVTPDRMIGILGNSRSATCYVTGNVDTPADADTILVQLGDLRGKPLKFRTRKDGFRWVEWTLKRLPYHYEAKPNEDDNYTILISLRNKES